MTPTSHRGPRPLPPRLIEDTGVRILFGVFLFAALCVLWHEMEPAQPGFPRSPLFWAELILAAENMGLAGHAERYKAMLAETAGE